MPYFQKTEILSKLSQYPLVPVFYNKDAELTRKILKSCYDGGIRAFEFTNRGENALEVFEEIYKYIRTDCPEMALGIGTIFNGKQAREFIDLGADFVVQPITSREVGEECQSHEVVWAPGAGTANEVYNAMSMGADIVKLFPGNVLGPGFVKSLKGPMPKVKLMVTGGVEPTEESINAWFKSGVTAVGLGSQLFPQDIIDKGDFGKLSEKISDLMKVVKQLI
jgi:2-dehydro-3-deoxyphosphogluconate aldolase / (4S)-4-hydroxy-2-oxoglutarate aldolase